MSETTKTTAATVRAAFSLTGDGNPKTLRTLRSLPRGPTLKHWSDPWLRVCHAVRVTLYPPGPTESPAIQTARWLLRPIAFLESCRRRYGDSFSLTFLGFSSPMVMLSDPAAIQALYTNPKHGLP